MCDRPNCRWRDPLHRHPGRAEEIVLALAFLLATLAALACLVR